MIEFRLLAPSSSRKNSSSSMKPSSSGSSRIKPLTLGIAWVVIAGDKQTEKPDASPDAIGPILPIVKISALGCTERKTLVVLGAGATRGAEFSRDVAVPAPLDSDFFRVLQMSRTGRTELGRALLEYVRDVYGPSLDVGMETVFNHLAAAATFHTAVRVDPGRTVGRPTRLIDCLRTVLPGLLGETVGDNDCRYHAALADALGTLDTVISLNYDCVIDSALKAYAGARFSASRGGYGVPASEGAENWAGTARGRVPAGSITLFKLHGSLNWRAAELPLRLRLDTYDQVADGVIQPPLTTKSVEDEPFLSIWRGARRAVRSMRRLIIIGYSMPDADGLVRTLLATDLQAEHLTEVIVVDPSPTVQQKHIDFFTRRAPRVRVFAFNTFREFEAVLST